MENALSRFFEAYQHQFTDYDDCEPRGAFFNDVQDRGVQFHQPDAGTADAFANLKNNPSRHGIVDKLGLEAFELPDLHLYKAVSTNSVELEPTPEVWVCSQVLRLNER